MVIYEALHPSQQIFSYAETISGLYGLNQYYAEDNLSCTRKQHSAYQRPMEPPRSSIFHEYRFDFQKLLTSCWTNRLVSEGIYFEQSTYPIIIGLY